MSQDITARKQAENHRDLLTKEMSHRVKNTLATVQSIVGQSLRSADVSPDVASTITQRLQALAGAHDVLTDRGWAQARLADIVASATAPFDSGGSTRIHAGGDEVEVSSRAATAIALAMHELATNAVKYGALSSDTGDVTINWTIDGGKFELVWTESGGPPVASPTRRGFGSRMIERVLSASIQGNAEIDYRAAGIVAVLRTDLEHLIEPTSAERGRDY
ncbi:sensor histidine kinase [Devosia sp. J2-20]|uniref:sensor histidine kinase n=1 Tax=Devosia sp. J2-20 TaxID=3026161 RepID=UPI0032B7F876